MNAPRTPMWLEISDDLAPRLYSALHDKLSQFGGSSSDLTLESIPYVAFLHFAACLQAADGSNREGKHAVAMALLRQSLEALALLAGGLSQDAQRQDVLTRWMAGKISPGEIRKHLEANVWPSFGHGLWRETWADFYSNLASAVQPYAHYSVELMGWQWQDVEQQSEDGEMFSLIGWNTYDALKASRITLVQALLVWSLGRVASHLLVDPALKSLWPSLERLRIAIGRSNMLFKEGAWASQLLPIMRFRKPGGWRDT